MNQPKGVTVKSINRVLRLVGLVMVVQVDDDGVTLMRIWIEGRMAFLRRCRG